MICACGYNKECGMWCGPGHTNGLCPPNTPENIRKAKIGLGRPRCDICREAAPFGDARNIWIGMHKHRIKRLLRKFSPTNNLNGKDPQEKFAINEEKQ